LALGGLAHAVRADYNPKRKVFYRPNPADFGDWRMRFSLEREIGRIMVFGRR